VRRTSTAGGRILIADGDAAWRALIAHVLEQAGYETVEAETGAEALEEVRADSIRLVMLEVSLPDMTGYEVCRQLRDASGDELAIFLLSGARTEPADRVAGLLLGADDFIVKPFDPGELRARVQRFLARRNPVARPEPQPHRKPITPREREVLRLLAEGHGQKEIARQLSISAKTVGTHIQRMLAKLGAHSRAELVARAYRDGLVQATKWLTVPLAWGESELDLVGTLTVLPL
jgi:DNA-binding NarL/FixJ family response regulator